MKAILLRLIILLLPYLNAFGSIEKAKMIFFSDDKTVDYKKAFSLFEEAYVEENNIEAARFLGLMYFQGKGVSKNNIKAIEYFEIAAEMGDIVSIRYLNKLRILGYDVTFEKQPVENKISQTTLKDELLDRDKQNCCQGDHYSQKKKENTQEESSVKFPSTESSFGDYLIAGRPNLKKSTISIEAGLLTQSSETHSLWDLVLGFGSGNLKQGFGFNLNASIGLMDIDWLDDAFVKINLGGGVSYARDITKTGFFSRFTPQVALLLNWDYFDNERTTEYTTGYDFSPLAYSDYYYRYYYTETTGTSFSFTNYTLKTGLSVELVRNFLYINYSKFFDNSFDDLPSNSSNQFTLTFGSPLKNEENYYISLVYRDNTPYFDEPLWGFVIVMY